jgi:hypothetical protein
MNAMPQPTNGNRSGYERRLAAAKSISGMFGRDPNRSRVDELIAERRAEARTEDLEDEARARRRPDRRRRVAG